MFSFGLFAIGLFDLRPHVLWVHWALGPVDFLPLVLVSGPSFSSFWAFGLISWRGKCPFVLGSFGLGCYGFLKL